MDLIIVADSIGSSQSMLEIVKHDGHRLLKLIGPGDEVASYVDSLCPDALIIITEELDRQALGGMKRVSKKKPIPILVFTRDSKEESIDAAVKAGASAYIIDCYDLSRLSSLLDVAKVRFNEDYKLKHELHEAKNALVERKVIEKAKGIIMSSKRITENEAYNAIRTLAMNKNKRIGEIAEQIISASELLV